MTKTDTPMDRREVQIDGQWYDKEANQVVPRSVTLFGVTLSEYGQYENYFGKYEVLGISTDNKTMLVKYNEVSHLSIQVGDQKTYPVAAQAETIGNAQKQARQISANIKATEFKGDKDEYTVAYIREHGFIEVTAPPQAQSNFSNRYARVTKDTAEAHIGKGYTPTDNEGWWSVTMRVYIPLGVQPEKLSLPEEGVRVDGDRIRISNNAFVWGLFCRGLKIGSNKMAA